MVTAQVRTVRLGEGGCGADGADLGHTQLKDHEASRPGPGQVQH